MSVLTTANILSSGLNESKFLPIPLDCARIERIAEFMGSGGRGRSLPVNDLLDTRWYKNHHR
jgi:hypothetical protein